MSTSSVAVPKRRPTRGTSAGWISLSLDHPARPSGFPASKLPVGSFAGLWDRQNSHPLQQALRECRCPRSVHRALPLAYRLTYQRIRCCDRLPIGCYRSGDACLGWIFAWYFPQAKDLGNRTGKAKGFREKAPAIADGPTTRFQIQVAIHPSSLETN